MEDPFPRTRILSTSGVAVLYIFSLGWVSVYLFPWLGLLGRRVLAIPATSAAPERLFSTAGDVMTKKLSRLTCDNMEELVYLHEVLPQVRE